MLRSMLLNIVGLLSATVSKMSSIVGIGQCIGFVNWLTPRRSFTNRYSFTPLFFIKRHGEDHGESLGSMIPASNISSTCFSISLIICGLCKFSSGSGEHPPCQFRVLLYLSLLNLSSLWQTSQGFDTLMPPIVDTRHLSESSFRV